MKMTKTALALAMILMGALASGSALAYGHVRVGIGIGIGGPVFWPGYYPGPYYYPYYYYPPYPAVVTVPATPTTYVEQSQPQAAPGPAPSASWYYCADSRTYYPYVKQCPGGWQQVSPQPQPSPPQ